MTLATSQKKFPLRLTLIVSIVFVLVSASFGLLITLNKKDANALFVPWQTDVLQIASNATNKCFLTTDHKVFCWGRNLSGELGSGSHADSDHPQLVKDDNHVFDGKTITNIYATGGGYCALASGSLFCWGDDSDGMLGDGTLVSNSPIPVAVDTSGVLAGKTITAVSAYGDSGNICVIASGAPYCWGDNTYDQLGDGTTVSRSAVPVAVDTSGVLAGKTATSISTGFTSCVIASGAPYCWGSDINGMLGDGNNSGSASPVPVALDSSNVLAGKTVTSLAVFNGYGCLVASGDSYCWGREDGTGRLGAGSATVTTLPLNPVDTSGVLSGKHIDDVKVTQGYACALSGGSLYCWGDSGSSGIVVNSVSPIQIGGTLGGHHVDAFSLDDSSACAIADGAVSCWGDNTHGELGNNSTISSADPVAVDISGLPIGSAVSSITLLSSSPCIIAAAQPYCWGDNTYGNVGNGTTTDVLLPTSLVVQGIVVTSILPTSALTGIDTTRSFSIDGSGFIDSNVVVTVGGQVVAMSGTDSHIIGTLPSRLTPGPVDVTITNAEGQTLTLHDAITYITPPLQIITSAIFTESGGEKLLTVHGTDLLLPATQWNDGLSRSLVSLNGAALPFCTEGTPFTAQDLGGFGVPSALVSDTPPCYFLFDASIAPLITSTTATIRVADTFDITSEGTVSVDGSPAYTFNQPDTGGSGGETPPSTPPTTSPTDNTTSQPTAHISTTMTDTTSQSTAITIQVNDESLGDGATTIPNLPTFTGTAEPYSTVTVTVHSDPITCTTTADSTGHWSCTLSQSLPAGAHQVFVKVVAPDGTTSELGPYNVVVKDDTPAVVNSDSKPAASTPASFPWVWIVVGAIGLVVIIAIIVLVRRRKEA